MKKIIFGLIALFILNLSVLAADNSNEKIILKEIKVTNFELAPFDGTLEVDYELIPNDVENKEVVWSISGLQSGVTAEIEGDYKTNKAVGTIVLIIKNNNETMSSLKLTAKSGNVSKIVTVQIENQTKTEERYKLEVVKEIESLIKEAKEIDTKNEKAIEKAINKIETMLKNEEVKKSVKENLLEDFDEIKANYEEYKNEDKTDYSKIAIISGLVLAFLFGLYMIFKSNNKVEPKKTEVKKVESKKVETKKVEPKKSTKKPTTKKKK